MKKHAYFDGVLIEKKDVVRMNGQVGHVADLLFPNTQSAKDYACEVTGGVLFDFPTGLGLIVVEGFVMDEDFEFISRG